MVLDVMMPRMSGLEVCKQLRAQRGSIPIIMLTARGQELDKVVGLELGADDYVTKPFSIRELLARVKAVLRRTAVVPKNQDQHSFGDVEIDLRRQRVLKIRQGSRGFLQRVRAVEIFHLSFRRNAQSRSSSGRGLGIREFSNYSDGGYASGTSAPETRARSRAAAVFPHSARNRLSVRRLKQRSESRRCE